MADARIPDLNLDGSKTGRCLAVSSDDRLVGVPDGNTLKPSWRWASAGDVSRKQTEEAARKQAEAGDNATIGVFAGAKPTDKPAPKPDAK